MDLKYQGWLYSYAIIFLSNISIGPAWLLQGMTSTCSFKNGRIGLCVHSIGMMMMISCG